MEIRKILLAAGLTAFILLTVLAQSGGTTPYRQRLPEGEVSWYEGWIRVRAEVPLMQGVPRAQAQIDARRVALMKAQAAALRLAMRVPVDADRRLEELEAVRVKVQGIVRGGEVMEEKAEGNKVSLLLQVPLAGVKGISSEVYTVIVPELAAPPPPPPVAQNKPAPQAGSAQPPPQASKPKPRGLSTFAAVRVEAEDAGAKPALYPKIVDPSGEPVYSAATVKPEVAKSKAIARYVSRNETTEAPGRAPFWGGSLPLAIVDPRRWIMAQQVPPPPPPPPPPSPVPEPKMYEYQNPPAYPFEEEALVVKAVSAKGKLKADLVVTAADAQRLRENASLLEDANVIVVVRTDVGGVESKKGTRGGEFLFGRR